MIKKKYKHVVIATDVVIFTLQDGKLKTLLIKMKKTPYANHWAFPGGLIQLNESVDDAAKRQLREKAGLDNVYLEQLATFGDVDRDPFGRVVSVAYFALIPSDGLTLSTTQEYEGVQWFSLDHLPVLAYDHHHIVDVAIKRLRSKIEYTNIVYSLLPREFTFGELQRVYEVILEQKLDKRNFRKKILSLGIVKATDKRTIGQPNRPAVLYRFTDHRLHEAHMM